jgi:hypothetical protein
MIVSDHECAAGVLRRQVRRPGPRALANDGVRAGRGGRRRSSRCGVDVSEQKRERVRRIGADPDTTEQLPGTSLISTTAAGPCGRWMVAEIALAGWSGWPFTCPSTT